VTPSERNAFAWLGVVTILVCVIVLTGCASEVRVSLPDRFVPVPKREAVCDFGILRGTKQMRCREEFKREEWFLWT
jgi:hypothetical protein